MLKTALIFAGAMIALSLYAPQLLAGLTPAEPVAAPQKASVAAPAPVQTYVSPGDREQRINADAGGQYSVEASLDGQRVHMLVDTGATMVVISAAVADRIGLRQEGGRKWRVHTANGDAFAQETVIPTIVFGDVYMANVQALIADPSAGDVNLLGASFLKRLASVEQRNGMLILRQ